MSKTIQCGVLKNIDGSEGLRLFFFVIPFFFVVCAGVARDDMAFVVRHPEPGINAPVMRRSHLLMLDRVPR